MTRHFNLFVQTPRVIVEHYRSRYDVILFVFLVSFLPSVLTAYIFALSLTNSVIIIVVLILQARYFLIRERRTVHVVHQIAQLNLAISRFIVS